ncbi:hypothetical protein GPECTOR_95g697 [Gonium pectorale]|uniref:EGF-like domain-containing protein n=1 Tax=Gonium pectorale TaxID=33097 RepID=A0A150G0E9_GONPE|nr:hypothetical protein GPECTOR_95g697 [Gonium pectorale]|eukprot:KXZ43308.1 hypothetical protein GPECTOR_95g697 [Gonium pectorale]
MQAPSSSPPPGPAPSPAPLRLSVTYQQLESLDASQQQMLTRVVEAVRRILRKFILVRRPPRGGLLADPYCLRFSSRSGCLTYYPDFSSPGGAADATCGLAALLPEHVVNPANCSTRASTAAIAALGSTAAGPASGAGGGVSGYGRGCSSFAGTAGEATDMYLYITAVNNDDCAGGAAAWARPCLLDLGDNRPLVGAANVCPGALRMLDEASLTAVVAHEMIHALGFTDAMYNLTRRPDGSPRPISELVQSATVDGRSVMQLVSPGVRDAARAHFGCSALEGAQLEEDGSAGSVGSHWEYTLYQGEVMVASTIFAADGSPPTLSNMTLSYLEDTGWYVANRSAAGRLAWGAGAGCGLPSMSCKQLMAAEPGQRYFCDPTAPGAVGPSYSFSCSLDYKATGVCRSLNFTSGCGLLLSYNAEQTCTGPDAANDMPDVFGWGAGSASGRCLPIVYLFTAQVGRNRYTFPGNGRTGDLDAACFDTECSADGSTVFVKMLGQRFECPAGQYLSLPALLPGRYTSGRIGPCPPASALCATQSCPAAACNPAGGDCFNGRCYCHLAYTGADCGYNLITGQALPNAAADNVTANSSAGSAPGSGAGGPVTSNQQSAAWTQIVQLSIALYNPVPEVEARSAALAAALASWADLDPSAVRIAFVMAASESSANGQSTGASGSIEPLLSSTEDGTGSGSSSAASQVGQAYDATSGSGGGAHRRRLRGHGQQQQGPRRQQQAAMPLASPPMAPSPSPSPSASPMAAAAPASSVTAMLTAGGARTTTILVSRLRDGTQLTQLGAVLAAANFSAKAGSVSFQTVIAMVTAWGASPPPAPGALAAVSPASEGASSSRMVIIVAIAAGGVALAGIVVTLVAVSVLRARKAARARAGHKGHKREQAYRLHDEAGRFSGGGGGAGAAGGSGLAVHAYITPAAAAGRAWASTGGASAAPPPPPLQPPPPPPYGAAGGGPGGRAASAGGLVGAAAPSPLYAGPMYGPSGAPW